MDSKYEVLRQYFGYTTFRGGQEELIDAQLAGRDVFGIMPTGGGKSICYQVPALILDGVTLVVSPLISLMTDQVTALKKAGVPAAYINSSLTQTQIAAVYRNLTVGKYKIIYIAPERLLTEGFLSAVKQIKVSLLAVDEAHCISQWGQDFRPSYLRIVDFLNLLPYRPIVAAFTATATMRVRDDVERILQLRDPLRVTTGFDRPNLHFEVIKPKRKAAELLQLIRRRGGKSGIVYCATRKYVEKLCAFLRENGINATRYHAGLSEQERHSNQEDFIYDRCTVMVATNAFGMGIDKSNVSYVIHYNMPQSIEAYYQEAGRAGRDGSEAECILLFNKSDIETARYFIHNSAENEELTDEQRQSVIQQDLQRLDKMVGYCQTSACLRKYILNYFGEVNAPSCGHCGNCVATYREQDITTEAKMILSCIKRIQDRLGYNLGTTGVVRVLTGSKDRNIMQLGLNTLSTYGLMHGISRTSLREMIEVLEERGYVYTDPRHRGLCLTEQAGNVLFRGQQVYMRVPTDAADMPAVQDSNETQDTDISLFEALKLLRLRIATEEQVPAYVVFTNASLKEMSFKKPTTIPQLLDINGVGMRKAEKYGEQFIEEIKKDRNT